jgi:hypothetical protein
MKLFNRKDIEKYSTRQLVSELKNRGAIIWQLPYDYDDLCDGNKTIIKGPTTVIVIDGVY